MKKKRAGPGRPEGESFARETILRAAEATFAERGYAGTSLRRIVERAHVTQALVTYYFGTKEALFREVFLSRGRQIARERLAGLKLLQKKRNVTLADVVTAYLKPALAMRATPEGRSFIRLQARMHTEPNRFAENLRRDVYDDTLRQYLAQVRKVVPGLSLRTAYWRMVLMVGAYLYGHSDALRLQELSRGACNPDDQDEMLRQITAFAVGGLAAPDGKAARRGGRGAGRGS
jgi:AcrR family transcriptional regulator